MGYTHTWKIINRAEWLRTWRQLLSDTRLIIQSADVALTRNGEDNDGLGPDIHDKGIYLNGDPDNSHEPFELERCPMSMSFCKTALKPYDLVVTAILLRASMLAPGAIKVR